MEDRDLRALEHLYPLYLHDLSAFTDHYRLDEDGRWTPYYLDDWRARGPECSTLILRIDGAAAGFAWVSAPPFPYMPQDVDYRLCEFFVAKPFRRAGQGARFAQEILARFPGSWQLEVVLRNEPALLFWRRLLEPYGATETRRETDYAFRFSSPIAPSTTSAA